MAAFFFLTKKPFSLPPPPCFRLASALPSPLRHSISFNPPPPAPLPLLSLHSAPFSALTCSLPPGGTGKLGLFAAVGMAAALVFLLGKGEAVKKEPAGAGASEPDPAEGITDVGSQPPAAEVGGNVPARTDQSNAARALALPVAAASTCYWALKHVLKGCFTVAVIVSRFLAKNLTWKDAGWIGVAALLFDLLFGWEEINISVKRPRWFKVARAGLLLLAKALG